MSQIPTTDRLATRASNKDRHPGLPDAKVRRRSHVEVAEERNLAEMEKELSIAKRKISVSKVALLEERMQVAYTSDMKNAANPGTSAAKKATKNVPAVSASSTMISELADVSTKGGKVPDADKESQDKLNDVPRKIRPTVRSEIMVERSKAEQSSKSNLKRKAVEDEHSKSNSLASMDAQRMARLHQPHTPSGLNPGFSTGKKTFLVFKIPALPQARLPSVSTSTPLRLGPRLQAASTLNSDNTISGMDYGGLEDEDESREGAAIPRVMARQRDKESSSKENDHTFEVPDIHITHGHGFPMQAIQEDNANHNAVMPADLDEDGDIVEEFESLPRHTPASVKIQHHNLPEVDQFPPLSQPR